jgi:hypothetical protein
MRDGLHEALEVLRSHSVVLSEMVSSDKVVLGSELGMGSGVTIFMHPYMLDRIENSPQDALDIIVGKILKAAQLKLDRVAIAIQPVRR